jgi:hypothetical protein
VHSHSYRDPGIAAVVAGLPHEVAGCADGARRVLLPREAGDEEGDGLVPDELVDDAVPMVDDPRGRPVEAREQLPELPGRALLRESS